MCAARLGTAGAIPCLPRTHTDVEAQAQRPILNPIEMGTPSAEFAVERIGSIPTYVVLFEACHNGPALGPSRINPSHA